MKEDNEGNPFGLESLLSWAFKGLIGAVMGMIIFFAGQLNSSIQSLTQSIQSMSAMQISLDKRISSIEQSREINMAQYSKMLDTVAQNTKDLIELKIQLQEFRVYHVKSH